MRRSTKAVALLLTASMLMPLCSCADKTMDQIPELAASICGDVKVRDYDKLMDASRFEDEALEEIFDMIGEDEAKEMVADTLAYEIDADSLQKIDKTNYSIDVTFSYVDHEAVLEDESIVSADDFENGIQDSSDLIEVTITMLFYKDGSDIFFMNLGDIEKLYPYADEAIEFHEEPEEEPVIEDEPAAIEGTEEQEEAEGGVIDLSDPNHRTIGEGDTFTLPGTDLLVTVSEGVEVEDRSLRNDVDIWCGYFVDEDTDFYMYGITTEGVCGYDPTYGAAVMDQFIADTFSDWDESYGYIYQNPDTEFVIGGTAYPARWITEDSDSIYHSEMYIVAFGNEDVCYLLVIATTDQAYTDDIIGAFSTAT